MQKNYIRASAQTCLTDSDILDMRDAFATGNVTARDLGILYGVDATTASRAVTGRSWTHVPSPRTMYNGQYTIYPDGRVRSTSSKKFLTPRTGKDGIPTVTMTINGNRKSVAVPYLVAKAFISSSVRPNAKIEFINGSDTHFTNLLVKKTSN